MKFSNLVTALVGAQVVYGAALTEKRRERNAARLAARKSNVRLPATNSEGFEIQGSESSNDTAHVEYSSNWSGAVLIGTGYKSVTGTFVVPTPKVPTGGSTSTQYAASAWVGIDGDTASNSILQTGVDFYVKGSTVSYDAWYEWYPDYAYDFSGISISAGDTITVTVTATTTKTGTAVVKNVSKGTSVTHTFTSQSQALQELNAEWIVEDFEENSSLVPFANFGTVTFTGASATGASGAVGPSGADILDIEQSGKVLTSVSTSSSSVTVKYTG